MRKPVTIFMRTRDENGVDNGNTEAYGHTDDDGATAVIGLGYLYGIQNALPGDVILTVHQPAVVFETVAVTSVTPNEESGEQVISFTLG